MIQKFRKKPFVVEALQWDGVNSSDILDFITTGCEVNARTRLVTIPTPEGFVKAQVGDWIIKGVAGEFYPCKNDIFSKTYELAPEKPQCDWKAIDQRDIIGSWIGVYWTDCEKQYLEHHAKTYKFCPECGRPIRRSR